MSKVRMRQKYFTQWIKTFKFTFSLLSFIDDHIFNRSPNMHSVLEKNTIGQTNSSNHQKGRNSADLNNSPKLRLKFKIDIHKANIVDTESTVM